MLLFRALESKNNDKLIELLKEGHNPNFHEYLGETPLHRACYHNNVVGLKILLKAGAKIDAQDIGGIIPFHTACSLRSMDCVRELLDLITDIDQKTKDGHTPLHLACVTSDNLDCVQTLLRMGASVNVQSIDKWTPLHLSCANGHNIYVKELLEAGANYNLLVHESMTPLHLAVRAKSLSCVTLLLKYQSISSSIIDSRDHKGRTALHYACDNGQFQLVSELLKAGVDTKIEDRSGSTALKIAKLHMFYEIVTLIEEYEMVPDIKEPEY